MLLIPFPYIDPYILRFGELGVTWYSLSYVLGIILGWKYASYLISKKYSKISLKDFDDYITWLIISIIVGGRLGYVLLYDPIKYFSDPITILQTYKGGMSFHGGLIGVGISSYFFCKIRKLKFLDLTDLLAQGTPFGLFFGRIANFINGELYGHETDLPWGVVFPSGGDYPRHPSQLYEAFLEGCVIFIVLYYMSLKKDFYKKQGTLTAIFLISYGIARFICEFFRLPDFEVNFLNLSSGQLYSLPMIFYGTGLILFKINYGNKKQDS